MKKNSKGHNKFHRKRLTVEILQAKSPGLALSFKIKIFGLREPQEEILQFYVKTTITFKWAYYQIGIYFCEISYIFQLPKDCFSTYKLLDILKSSEFFLNEMALLKNARFGCNLIEDHFIDITNSRYF